VFQFVTKPAWSRETGYSLYTVAVVEKRWRKREEAVRLVIMIDVAESMARNGTLVKAGVKPTNTI